MKWVRSIHRAMAPVRFSWGAFLVMLAFILLADGVVALLYWKTGFLGSSLTILMQKLATVCFALFYGFHRGWSFHPGRDSKYMEWLRESPWTPSKALPMGPVNLVWQDAAVLGILMGLAMRPFPCAMEEEFTGASYPTFTVLAFLAGYLPCLLIHGLRGGNFPLLWKIAPFVVGVAVAFPHWPLMTLLALAAYPIVWANVQRELSRAAAAIPPTISVEIKSCGWNFMKLSTHGVPRNIPKRVAATAALAAGLTAPLTHLLLIRRYGTTQAGQALLRLTAPHYLGIGFAILIVTLFLLRILLYSASASPFRIRYRLFNRRWVVPEHDRICVAPLAIVGIGAACVWLAIRTNVPDWIVYGFGSAAAMYSCLAAGPERRSWYLTGPRHVADAIWRPSRLALRSALRHETPIPTGRTSILRWTLPIPGLSLFNRWILTWFLFGFVLPGLALSATGGFRPSSTGVGLGCVAAYVSAILYLVSRSTLFHPCAWPEYRAWMELSPWAPGTPLPLGPVAPRWQDMAVFLAPLALHGTIFPHSNLPAIFPQETLAWLGLIEVGILLLAYAAGTCLALLRTGEYRLLVAEAFALGGFVWAWPNPVATTTVAAGMAALGAWGVTHSLKGFPWTPIRQRKERKARTLANRATPARGGRRQSEELELGEWVSWMLGAESGCARQVGPGIAWLSPKVAPNLIGVADRVALIGMIGWFLGCLLSRPIQDSGTLGFVSLIPIPIACVGAITRIILYVNGIAAPISLLGRLGTGRLIVPRFDRVFLAPLSAIGLSVLLSLTGLELGLPLPFWVPASVVAVLLVLALGGPSLTNWRLTGAYRVHLKPRAQVGDIDLLALFKRLVSAEEESKKPAQGRRIGS